MNEPGLRLIGGTAARLHGGDQRFKVRHLGLTNVRGRFNGVDASLVVGDDLRTTRIEATIQIDTIDTNQADRDAHLRSTDSSPPKRTRR